MNPWWQRTGSKSSPYGLLRIPNRTGDPGRTGNGAKGLLDQPVTWRNEIANNQLIIATKNNASWPDNHGLQSAIEGLSEQGFLIRRETLDGKSVTLIMGNDPAGTLYGVFHFLRLMQMQQSIRELDIRDHPA